MDCHQNSTRLLKNNYNQTLSKLWKTERRSSPNLFYEASISLIFKPGKGKTTPPSKKTYRTVQPINTYVKVLNKMLINWIQAHIKKTVHQYHAEFFSRNTELVQHMQVNKYNKSHKWTQWKNSNDDFKRCRKHLCESPTCFDNKSPIENRA